MSRKLAKLTSRGSSRLPQSRGCLALLIPLPCSGILDLVTVCGGGGSGGGGSVFCFVIVIPELEETMCEEKYGLDSVVALSCLAIGCWYFHLWREVVDTFRISPPAA